MPSLKLTPSDPSPQEISRAGADVSVTAALGRTIQRGADDWWQPNRPKDLAQQQVVLEGPVRAGQRPANLLGTGPNLAPESESRGLVQPSPQNVTLGPDPTLSVRVHPKWGEKMSAATVGVGPMAPEGSPSARIGGVPGQLTSETSVSAQVVGVLYPNQVGVMKIKAGLQSPNLAAGVTVVDAPGGNKDAVEYWGRVGSPQVNVSGKWVDRPAPQPDSMSAAVNVAIQGEQGAKGDLTLGVQKDGANETKVRMDFRWFW